MKKILTIIFVIQGTLALAQQQFYDVTPASGNGLRLWSSDHYKISMGNTTEYQYGPVSDYSIKMNMTSHTGRGWVWGLKDQTPVAALSNVGTLQLKGSIYALGSVGIGTAQPDSKLAINVTSNLNSTKLLSFQEHGTSSIWLESQLEYTDGANAIRLGSSMESSIMTWRRNGNVGIGTAQPDSKLTVAGNIHSREVKVTVDAGADFVFDESYKLRTLEETEKFISENKHLPDMASEDEMLENGLQVGEMNIKLLQKIEELTLYLIEQNKQNLEQQKLIQQLQSEFSALKNK